MNQLLATFLLGALVGAAYSSFWWLTNINSFFRPLAIIATIFIAIISIAFIIVCVVVPV